MVYIERLLSAAGLNSERDALTVPVKGQVGDRGKALPIERCRLPPFDDGGHDAGGERRETQEHRELLGQVTAQSFISSLDAERSKDWHGHFAEGGTLFGEPLKRVSGSLEATRRDLSGLGPGAQC